MINHFNININSQHQSPIMVENRVGDEHDHEKNSTSPLNTPIFNSNSSNSLLKSNNTINTATTTTNNDDNIQKMDAPNSFELNQKFMDPPPSTPSPSSSSMSSSMSSSPSSSSSLSSSPSLSLMMDDEKQWFYLMSEIDRACRLLAISADPYNWNKTEVRKWLKHQQRLHQLTQPMFSELLNFFDMDGMSLCELTIEDFHQRISDSTTLTTGSATVAESPSMQNLSWKCATILYNELMFWRNAITSHCIEPDLEFFDLDPQFEQSTINDHHHHHHHQHPNSNFDQSQQQQQQQHRHPVRSLNPYGPSSSPPVSYGSGYQLQQQQPHQQQPQRNNQHQQQMYHQMDGYQTQSQQQQMIHLYNNNNNNPSLCNSAVYSTPPSPAGSSHSSSMMMSPNNNQQPPQPQPPPPQSSVNHVAYSTNNNNHHHNHNKFPYPNQQQPQPQPANPQNATCPGVPHHNGSGYLVAYTEAATFLNQSSQQPRITINGGGGGGGNSLMMHHHHHYQQTSDYGSDCYILSDDEMSDDSACETTTTMNQIQDYLKSSTDFPGMMMKFNGLPQPPQPGHKSSSSSSNHHHQQISLSNGGIGTGHRTTHLPSASPSSNGRPHGSTSIQLWQFLKELLSQPQTYGTSIRWLERPKGVFKIEDSVRVAKLWGERKKRPAMNYDKLSRSIRQYYKKGIMKKTERAQRLVYQFCQPYSL